jgi:hypothetical protein
MIGLATSYHVHLADCAIGEKRATPTLASIQLLRNLYPSEWAWMTITLLTMLSFADFP